MLLANLMLSRDGNMLRKSLIITFNTVATLVALATPSFAFNFGFTFDNALNGGGSVTGIIRGLDEGTGAATSVEVLSNTTGLGIGEYVGSPLTNTWTVLGGDIVAFDFLSAGVLNSAPAVQDALLFLDSTPLSGASFRAGITPSPGPFVTGSGFVSTADIGLTFTRLDDDTEAIPEPLSVLGTLAAVGMGVAMKRKHSEADNC
ncbi:MAG: PEP-CTERM sorting domain-containing protein [Cyanobacteria bacterium P01_F01_bin.150]